MSKKRKNKKEFVFNCCNVMKTKLMNEYMKQCLKLGIEPFVFKPKAK